MKVYAIEYDFYMYTIHSCCEPVNVEHRLESYTDLTEFINRVKYLNENKTSFLSGADDYIRNIKVYSGDLSEVALNKVLNPF